MASSKAKGSIIFPTGYYAIGGSSKNVALSGSANGKADFLLNGLGKVAGTLFFDGNGNGVFDSHDIPINLENVSIDSLALTDSSGPGSGPRAESRPRQRE